MMQVWHNISMAAEIVVWELGLQQVQGNKCSTIAHHSG